MGLLFLDNAFEGFRHRGVRKIVWVTGRPVIAFPKPNRIVLEFRFICCNGSSAIPRITKKISKKSPTTVVRNKLKFKLPPIFTPRNLIYDFYYIMRFSCRTWHHEATGGFLQKPRHFTFPKLNLSQAVLQTGVTVPKNELVAKGKTSRLEFNQIINQIKTQ